MLFISFAPSFPAAQTAITPLLSSFLIASFMRLLGCSKPLEMTTTSTCTSSRAQYEAMSSNRFNHVSIGVSIGIFWA